MIRPAFQQDGESTLREGEPLGDAHLTNYLSLVSRTAKELPFRHWHGLTSSLLARKEIFVGKLLGGRALANMAFPPNNIRLIHTLAISNVPIMVYGNFDKAQERALVVVLTLLKGLRRESRSSYMHGFPKKYGPSFGVPWNKDNNNSTWVSLLGSPIVSTAPDLYNLTPAAMRPAGTWDLLDPKPKP